MRPNRRQFLASATAAAVLPACADDPLDDSGGPTAAPSRDPEPAPWDAPGRWDEASFAWGVRIGDATSDTALVACRSAEPALTLVLMRADGDEWVQERRFHCPAPINGVTQVGLVNLAADAAYSLAFYAADGERRSEVARFRSALGPGGYRVLRFGATSCLGSENPDWESLNHAAAEAFDFFLLLGDTVYADGAYTVEEYRAYWERAFATPSLRSLSNSTSLVATWDDHEVGNNWILGETVTVEQVENATLAFREDVPMQVGPGGSGLWRTLRWGEVLQLFVLDCRGERDVDQIVSPEQLLWLVDALAISTARFKVVLSSVHFTDHSALFGTLFDEDRWQGYPAQRQVALEAALATPGVVFVTGDLHYGGLATVSPPGVDGDDLYEVAAGPSGSFINPIAELFQGDRAQYPVLLGTWSYCLFEADPGTGTLRVAFVDDQGTILADETLTL
ncbi:MAG: alkaline phosphatase D family protein [Alphaproteobacteria bacterium]|nr:alkaline phosphatase D family protein [Alphaproteobacteria bacterium]